MFKKSRDYSTIYTTAFAMYVALVIVVAFIFFIFEGMKYIDSDGGDPSKCRLFNPNSTLSNIYDHVWTPLDTENNKSNIIMKFMKFIAFKTPLFILSVYVLSLFSYYKTLKKNEMSDINSFIIGIIAIPVIFIHKFIYHDNNSYLLLMTSLFSSFLLLLYMLKL